MKTDKPALYRPVLRLIIGVTVALGVLAGLGLIETNLTSVFLVEGEDRARLDGPLGALTILSTRSISLQATDLLKILLGFGVIGAVLWATQWLRMRFLDKNESPMVPTSPPNHKHSEQ